ncbi:MAG: hypothetical protein KAJ10_03610 [Thermodesulfovibrionia bacterium]|nr:hypothetical protein [Thermodesulfovibrionia bacterium]
MPRTKKGQTIMTAMKKQYGSKKGGKVFHASVAAGKLKGVEKRKKHEGRNNG